jgi:DNA-binding CsgD family transcriptional regulator
MSGAAVKRRPAARRAAAADVSPLTPREREILVLVAAGKANKEIARELWLSIVIGRYV